MTPTSMIALATAMLILALIPGPAMLAITARTMKQGFAQGALMTVGILLADFVFILMSMAGLLALAQLLGGLFIILKYLGAAYLIWLAISIWREPIEANQETIQVNPGSALLSGFIITLGNPKAILFYVGFFPAFLDMSVISASDIAIVYGITILTVGGVTLGYAFLASRAARLFMEGKLRKRFNFAAGGIMAGSGVTLLLKD